MNYDMDVIIVLFSMKYEMALLMQAVCVQENQHCSMAESML
jgi:hypothetical protein